MQADRQGPHHPPPVPLEIMVKTRFSFHIFLSPYLWHLFLLVPLPFQLYLDCTECIFSLCVPVPPCADDVLLIWTWFLFLMFCHWTPLTQIYRLDTKGRGSLSFKNDPADSILASFYHLRPLCALCFLFVQRIYTVVWCSFFLLLFIFKFPLFMSLTSLICLF